MPSKSERQELQELVLVLYTYSSEFNDTDFMDEDSALLSLSVLEFGRYLIEPREVRKSKHWINIVLPNLDNKRFRSQLRMEKGSFLMLLDKIKDDQIFILCQEPLPLQLAVVLHRFGMCGNSSGFMQVAGKFGLSEGSIHTFTSRIISALEKFSDESIKWPNALEQTRISSDMATKLFPNCIGFIDGSDAVLYQAPVYNKETYWSRKKKYSLQFQVVCDPNRLIRHFFTGYPGSVHDAKVYQSSSLFTNPTSYFSGDQYILGDSAYPLSNTLLPPFKRRHGTLRSAQAKFNKQLSKHRVVVEHTIGIPKGRFQSLRGLRINVKSSEDHVRACKWIHCCVILHNILMKFDPCIQDGDEIYLDDQIQVEENIIPGTQTGELRRLALVEIVNAMGD